MAGSVVCAAIAIEFITTRIVTFLAFFFSLCWRFFPLFRSENTDELGLMFCHPNPMKLEQLRSRFVPIPGVPPLPVDTATETTFIPFLSRAKSSHTFDRERVKIDATPPVMMPVSSPLSSSSTPLGGRLTLGVFRTSVSYLCACISNYDQFLFCSIKVETKHKRA